MDIIDIRIDLDWVHEFAEENELDIELCLERAEKWAQNIEDTVSNLAYNQLESCIRHDSP